MSVVEVSPVPMGTARPVRDEIINCDTDEDDSISVTSSSLADDSSRSATPTHQGRARKGNKNKKPRIHYKCTGSLKEDHGQPLFCCQFNWFTKDGDPQIFATVGTNRVTIYECVEGGKCKLNQSYEDSDADENFYACAWTVDDLTGDPLLAVAGSRGVIRIISPSSMQCIKHFTGHGGSINDLKFNPKDHNILLSASKDHSLRMWNLKTDVCVAVFGGVDGHRDEVLSADFNLDGTMIVSCGMDHSLKIWQIGTKSVQMAIARSFEYCSMRSDVTFETFIQHYPDFTTRDIHRNYVDCCRWHGNLILSKSCENSVSLWKPGSIFQPVDQIKLADSKVTVLHNFQYREGDIWYMRFSMDYYQQILALGTQYGRCFIWDLDVEDLSHARHTVLQTPKCNTPIRQTHMTRDGSTIICVCDNGTIWRWDRTS